MTPVPKLHDLNSERRDTIMKTGFALRKKVMKHEPTKVDESLYMRPQEVL